MAIDKPKTRPTVPDVMPLVQAVYARHAAGCCLHVMIDDGNVADVFATGALVEAYARGHADCIAAAEILAQMTTTQRRKVAGSGKLPARS